MPDPYFSEIKHRGGNDQNQSLSTTDGASCTAGTQDEGAIPCFLAGTMIMTQRGEKPIEALRPGDMVLTRDGGFAPVRWIGSIQPDARGANFERNAPICIPKGAIGRGLPERDLYVSPHHRIWMHDPSYEIYFDDHEVLIPAKHLVGWNGITQVSYVPKPEYFQVLFDSHQIILSDGLPTESFHPGEATIEQFATDTRDELLRMFPDLITLCSEGHTARRCLRSYEVPLALKAKFAA